MRREATLRPGRFFGRVVRERRVGGLRFNETEYAPGAHIPRHAHERAYVCLVRRGEYVESFGRRGRECGPQTVAYHPPGEEHDERIRGAEVRSFNVELDAEWLARVGVPPARLAAGEAAPGGPATWRACALYRDVLVGAADLDLEARTATLARALVGGDDVPARLPRRWLERVRERLHEDLDRPLRLAELASAAGVHPVHLSAEFRRRAGATVGDYRRTVRVRSACQALAATDRPLAGIASSTGFCDQAHFTRVFKRTTGFTPARYRGLFR